VKSAKTENVHIDSYNSGIDMYSCAKDWT